MYNICEAIMMSRIIKRKYLSLQGVALARVGELDLNVQKFTKKLLVEKLDKELTNLCTKILHSLLPTNECYMIPLPGSSCQIH